MCGNRGNDDEVDQEPDKDKRNIALAGVRPARYETKKEEATKELGPGYVRGNLADVAQNMPHLAQPALSPRHAHLYGEKEGHNYEEIRDPLPTTSTPKSRLAAPFSPHQRELPRGWQSCPLDFSMPPPRKEEEPDEDDLDFGAASYLGPRFPSMEPGAERRSYREELQDLQELINEELQNVHRLEGNISTQIYGHRNEHEPCSLLDYQDVVHAVSSPQLLAKDPKEQLEMMRDVLQLMKEAKSRHKRVLAQLQEIPPRQSERLKLKPKRDFKKFDRGY